MSINTAPLFDYNAWIQQVPDFDWDSLEQLTSVTATAPTFDDVADTYTIPTKAGVQYKVDGVNTTAGIKPVGDVAATIVVTAVAKAGYKLTGTATWTGTFTVDAVGE